MHDRSLCIYSSETASIYLLVINISVIIIIIIIIINDLG
jgi:hypothetical protein